MQVNYLCHNNQTTIQIATTINEKPIPLFNMVADLVVVNNLLNCVPKPAHVITAGKPNMRFNQTSITFAPKPGPNKRPNWVINTRKWIHALPLTICKMIPVIGPNLVLFCSSSDIEEDLKTWYPRYAI